MILCNFDFRFQNMCYFAAFQLVMIVYISAVCAIVLSFFIILIFFSSLISSFNKTVIVVSLTFLIVQLKLYLHTTFKRVLSMRVN